MKLLTGTTLMMASSAMAGSSCTWGPSYWCKSQANAAECGDATTYDSDMCTNYRTAQQATSTTTRPVLGANKCTWGPAYWCASEANAAECGDATTYNSDMCTNYRTAQQPTTTSTTRSLLGTNKCTWGPAYWCASEANAAECGDATTYDSDMCTNYRTAQQPTTTSTTTRPLLGANKCTWGTSYWCASEANAAECGDATTYNSDMCSNYRTAQQPITTSTTRSLLGTNKCTWGPAYWCASEANAAECGDATTYESDMCTNYRTAQQPTTTSTTTRPVLGANKCTWGPSYWCKSQANAAECGDAATYDSDMCTNYRTGQATSMVGNDSASLGPNREFYTACKNEGRIIAAPGGTSTMIDPECMKEKAAAATSTTTRSRPGSNKCTWGPSYWCASEANAAECEYLYLYEAGECAKYMADAKN